MNKIVNQIVILNGGKGSRVKSIASGKPKCLIDINNKPFLYRQLKLIKKNNVKNVVICCAYKSEMIINEIEKKYIKDLKLNIKISTEKKTLGTGGAILNAYKYLEDNFFIIYGDSWLKVNFNKVAKKFIDSKKNGLMTLIKSSLVKNHKPNVKIEKNTIIAYKKNSIIKDFKFIDYGLIILKKNVLLSFKKNLKTNKFDLNRIIKNLIINNNLSNYNVDNQFYTIGTPKDIKAIKKIFK